MLLQLDEHAKNTVIIKKPMNKTFLRATAGSKMMSDIKVTNPVTCFHLPFSMLQNKHMKKVKPSSKKQYNWKGLVSLFFFPLSCSTSSNIHLKY